MNFQLHPFGQPGGDRQTRQAHGFLGIHRAAGIGQQQIFFGINKFENVGEGIPFAGQIRAAQRDRDHFRPAGFQGIAHGLGRREFSCAQNQARPENPSRQ